MHQRSLGSLIELKTLYAANKPRFAQLCYREAHVHQNGQSFGLTRHVLTNYSRSLISTRLRQGFDGQAGVYY